LFTRYTLVSAAISIIPEFIEKIELDAIWKTNFVVTKDEIINILQTGSKIIFKGIKDKFWNTNSKLKIFARSYNVGT
jgi:phage terminase large subunit